MALSAIHFLIKFCELCSPHVFVSCFLLIVLTSFLSAYLGVLSGSVFEKCMWPFCCCYIDWRLLLAFEGGMYGEGEHAIQLTVHGTVLPPENHPVKMLVKHPSSLCPTPSPRNTGPYSSPAHLHKLALITLCCSTPSLPGCLLYTSDAADE